MPGGVPPFSEEATHLRLRTGRWSSMRFGGRVLLWLAASTFVVACVAVGAGWYVLDGSLPRLDGTARADPASGLQSRAAIVRDNAGRVTIEARSRIDAAFATGYAHAQDRFFQMDLLRRVAAGELSELFGQQALRVDELNRMHRFRAHARDAVHALPADQRAMLDAYAAGVNAGLASLKIRPFEYVVLRMHPQPWRAEDSMLALYAMYLDLQSGEMRQIVARGVLAQQISPALSQFLLQRVTHWDAPLDRAIPVAARAGVGGAGLGTPGVGAAGVGSAGIGTPGAGAADVGPTGVDTVGAGTAPPMAIPAERPPWLDAPAGDAHSLLGAGRDADWRSAIGSNSFAVSGARAMDAGAAMVANDMHLGLNLPNIWYRLVIHVSDAQGRDSMRVAGVSLPGAPIVVVGSNGNVAWGFTNSYGHYLDLVELDTDPANPGRYRSPAGASVSGEARPATDSDHAQRRPLNRREASPSRPSTQADSTWQTAVAYRETIVVHGAAPVAITVYETRWGPEWRVAGRVYAVHWIAHDPEAANLTLSEMEKARDVGSAMRVAQRSGVPTQNIVIAARDGHIGWTLAGPLPRRPRDEVTQLALPVAAQRYVAWDGYLDPASYPERIDPDVGALWTANNRQLDSADQQKIGDGGADVGARATQIRDDLAARNVFDERGLLAIQLDDRAKALAFWRETLLATLDAPSLEGHADRQALHALVSQWDAHAGVDSVGYTLVRDFQAAMYEGWFGALDAQISGVYAGAGYRTASSRSLAVMETLASAQAWVPRRYANWHAFVLDRVDAVIARDTANGAALDDERWGDRNRAAITHPFARLMPAAVASYLSAPADRLPGDINMPRVQGRGFGASERMVVAPGHEDQGILEMPGGASGHPLSPFFLAGHEDWAQGRASAFLPGPEAHRLTLVPAAD